MTAIHRGSFKPTHEGQIQEAKYFVQISGRGGVRNSSLRAVTPLDLHRNRGTLAEAVKLNVPTFWG
jgi:hypothetical protein